MGFFNIIRSNAKKGGNVQVCAYESVNKKKRNK